jgi:hypothetical protein
MTMPSKTADAQLKSPWRQLCVPLFGGKRQVIRRIVFNWT